ncbi:MAG: hypothetical protein WC621_04245 [Patescibacteria group bacterium]
MFKYDPPFNPEFNSDLGDYDDEKKEKSCRHCDAPLKGGTIVCSKCHTINSELPEGTRE